MPEYEDYLVRAEEALASAHILLENEKFNSAISEAYYSMYYSARPFSFFVSASSASNRALIPLRSSGDINKKRLMKMWRPTIFNSMPSIKYIIHSKHLYYDIHIFNSLKQHIFFCWCV